LYSIRTKNPNYKPPEKYETYDGELIERSSLKAVETLGTWKIKTGPGDYIVKTVSNGEHYFIYVDGYQCNLTKSQFETFENEENGYITGVTRDGDGWNVLAWYLKSGLTFKFKTTTNDFAYEFISLSK